MLPSKAHAKITCRLVANQDPDRIVRLLSEHVEVHTPPGPKVVVTPNESTGTPYLMPADHPANAAARAVHQELYGVAPVYIRTGGSIPVCSMFLESLGAYTVNFAFGLTDERPHSPNEFYRLASFRRGQKGYCMLYHEIARRGAIST